MKRLILIAALALCSTSAFAWDCSIWTSNVPGMECYKPPTDPGASANANATSNQSQGQTQGQGQAQIAKGGNATSAATGGTATAGGGAVTGSGNSTTTNTNTAQGGTGGAGGNSHQGQNQSATASNTGNSQISSSYVAGSAPGVVLPNQLILGCGSAGSAGGSNVHGAVAMGFGWTTKDCYDYIDAQANLAVGDYQTACEILHSNPATERARRRGAKIADCALLVQRVEYVDQCGPQCNAEVLLRIEHAIAEYIETHPTPECPKPKPHHSHVTCKMQPVINVPPATVVQPSKIDVDVNVKQDRRTPGLDAPPPR